MTRFPRLALLFLLACSAVAFAADHVWNAALQLYNQQHWAEASAAFAAIETASPGKTDALLYQSRALVQLGRLTDAESAVETYVTSHTSADGLRQLGYVRFRMHKPTRSLDAYAAAAKLSKVTADDLVITAQDYLLMMDPLSASEALEQAVKLDPNNIEANYQICRVRYKQGRMEEAIPCFQKVLNSDPSRIKAQENLGLSFERAGQLDDALAVYQQAVKLDQAATAHDEHPYLYLGTLLIKMGRSQQALPILNDGLKLNPSSGKLHAQLGKAFANLKQSAEAQREMEEAARLDPRDGANHYALARLYASVGKNDLAEQQFQAAKVQFDAEKAKSNTMGMGREIELTPE